MNITANGIAIDCPDPIALARFYADILGVVPEGDYVRLPAAGTNLWFQPVADYLPPTWPTQERGQQLHLDLAIGDIDAGIEHARACGATLTDRRDGYHYPILLDPVGHPFCLVPADEPDEGMSLAGLSVDCDDIGQLAAFYQNLIGGEIDTFPDWANLIREDGIVISFQHAEGYQPPTWPTQERGQQMHIDFHSENRPAAVDAAIGYGAKLIEVEGSFTVLLDPAGHPFCICDPAS